MGDKVVGAGGNTGEEEGERVDGAVLGTRSGEYVGDGDSLKHLIIGTPGVLYFRL